MFQLRTALIALAVVLLLGILFHKRAYVTTAMPLGVASLQEAVPLHSANTSLITAPQQATTLPPQPLPTSAALPPGYVSLARRCTPSKSVLDAVLVFQWGDWNQLSSLEWVSFQRNNCSDASGRMRYGGSDHNEIRLVRAWAVEACQNAAQILQSSPRPPPSRLTIRTVGHQEKRQFRMKDMVTSLPIDSNATSAFMELPVGAANATAVYFLGELVSALAGHAYDYLAPQMWSILQTIGPHRDYGSVAIVVPTLPITSRSFAMEYYRMVRMAYPEFRWVEVLSDRPQFLSFSRDVTVVQQFDFGCARLLATLLWPRLRPFLLQRDLPKPRFVALLKMNASGYHFTRRFFSIAPLEHEEIQRRFDIHFLREDEPKEQRMWYTNTAQVFFTSSGANSDITRNFVSAVESSLRVLVDFIHPSAEQFARGRCALPLGKLQPGDLVPTIAMCLNRTTIVADDFEEALERIRQWGIVVGP